MLLQNAGDTAFLKNKSFHPKIGRKLTSAVPPKFPLRALWKKLTVLNRYNLL